MARWETHRTDANQQRIVKALEAYGASVVSINRPVDLAIGYRGRTALAEVKTARGKLRDGQREFIEGWRGLVRVLRSEDDALQLLKDMT